MDRAIVLRAGAALVALAAFVGSGSYVLAHPKNPAAPLQPPATEPLAVRSAAPSPTPGSSAKATPTRTPRITLAPGVRATELPRITYTHVS